VFGPPVPLDIVEFKLRITAAGEKIDRYILERVWEELYYRMDICRVTEHL
jgi:hypothetical protein